MVLTNNISTKHAPGGRTPPGVVFTLIACAFFIATSPALAQTATSPATLAPTVILSPAPTDTITATPTLSETTAPTAPETSPSPTSSVSSIRVDNQVAVVSTASAILNSVTIANTVSSGGNPQILNYTQPTTGTIDLASPAPCTASSSAALSALINNAAISNTIDVTSVTGNTAAGNATANVFNMANTTLSGSCWNFQVVNFFAPHTGDVSLPSVDRFFHPSASTMSPVTVTADVSNTATVTNTLSALANTGNIASATMKTGDATVQVRSQALLNTTVSGNNWIFLAIRSYGGWQGSLVNWPGQLVQTPGYTYAYLPPETVQPGNRISVENTASVINNIGVFADTANIIAPGSVNTKPADATINLFDMLNTTLSGSNWYFAYFTLFDSFNGNFIFPKTAETGSTRAYPTLTPTAITSTAVSGSTTAETVQDTPSDASPAVFSAVLSAALPTTSQPASPPTGTMAVKTWQPESRLYYSNLGPEQNAGFFVSLLAILSAIIKTYLLLRKTAG